MADPEDSNIFGSPVADSADLQLHEALQDLLNVGSDDDMIPNDPYLEVSTSPQPRKSAASPLGKPGSLIDVSRRHWKVQYFLFPLKTTKENCKEYTSKSLQEVVNKPVVYCQKQILFYFHGLHMTKAFIPLINSGWPGPDIVKYHHAGHHAGDHAGEHAGQYTKPVRPIGFCEGCQAFPKVHFT